MWVGILILRLPHLKLGERARDVSRRRAWGSRGDILAEKVLTTIHREDEPAVKLLPPTFESTFLRSVFYNEHVSRPLVTRSRMYTAHT